MTRYGCRVGAAKLAAEHGGRITWAQLLKSGLSEDDARTWMASGGLVRTCPRVYAIGYPRTDRVALTWQALLYAGPGARLSGGSSAYERGLIDYAPDNIIVATPRVCRSIPGVDVLGRRPGDRIILPSGFPVAPIPETMLELAATYDRTAVLHALAKLDFRRELDVVAIDAACGKGRKGSRALRRALERRIPQLAHCKSPLEVDFLLLLEAHHLPLPARVNRRLHGIEVDMYWPELNLVVELDGKGNHDTAYQRRRDASYMETLRGHGLTVVRFGYWDVNDAEKVPATLRSLGAHGVRRTGTARVVTPR